MTKNPDEENEDNENEVSAEVREYVEQMPGYQEHMREQRGDSLNFGDM